VGRALHISELSDILRALRRRPAPPPEPQSAPSERESQGP